MLYWLWSSIIHPIMAITISISNSYGLMTVTEFAIQHIQLLTIAHTNMLVENIMGLWGNNYPDTSG